VAGTNAGAKAPHAGDGGAGQQDGAHRLGPSGEGRKLPSSGGGHGVEPGPASEAVGDARSVEGGYGTTVGETGPEEPALSTVPASTLWVTWFRSANSHTGPQPKAAAEAGQMAATDIVPTHQKPLAFQGASTDGERPFITVCYSVGETRLASGMISIYHFYSSFSLTFRHLEQQFHDP
jgi:hypothetical protein